ncbi:MAG: hypothetical protein VW268_08925 [Rhodospirillaceae bacterium]
MTFHRYYQALCLTVMLAISACTTPDPAVTLPSVTFQHLPPLNLAVARIDVVRAYASPLKAPNIEHKMETTPTQALSVWANDRLKAVQPSGGHQARLTIDTASIVETPLKRTEGIRGAFTTDQSHRYDLDLRATIEILDRNGQRIGHATARINRNRTMPENATLNELHSAWFDLMENGLQEFNKEMELNMRHFLKDWVQ